MFIVSVVAHPRSKNSRIEKATDDVLHVYIKSEAKDNKANADLTSALAHYFSVPKSLVVLKKGNHSKIKTFLIG